MLKIKKKSHSGIHFKNSYYKIENGLEETGARFENDQRKELDPCSNPVCNYQYLEECLKSIATLMKFLADLKNWKHIRLFISVKTTHN